MATMTVQLSFLDRLFEKPENQKIAPAAKPEPLPDTTRARHGGNPQSEQANKVARVDAELWWTKIHAAVKSRGTIGMTAKEFVEWENQRRASMRIRPHIELHEKSGRFTELGADYGKLVNGRTLRLVRLLDDAGERVTRDGCGVWVTPEFNHTPASPKKALAAKAGTR